jgi:hypothetical protein
MFYPLPVSVGSFLCDLVVIIYGSLAALLINENGKHSAGTNKVGFLSRVNTSFL